MCTLFFRREAGVLAKNRDKNVPTVEEVLRTDRVIALRTLGADYFGLGINSSGCAFVSAAINSPAWTEAAIQGEVEKAQDIYRKENSGRTSPTKIVSGILPEAKSVDDILAGLKSAHLDWIGYNLLLVDPAKAILVEACQDELFVHELEDEAIATNHFRELRYGPTTYHGYANSYDRFEEAEDLLPQFEKNNGTSLLGPDNGQSMFWREGNFFTVSSSIIDLTEMTLAYRSLESKSPQLYGF